MLSARQHKNIENQKRTTRGQNLFFINLIGTLFARYLVPFYSAIDTIRRIALKGTELAHAYVGTLRLKLIKIGAVILRNTRRIRLMLASSCPYQKLFFHVAAKLAPG